ncbi:MAG: LamG domain-containing protein [Planctomycetota bacterium]|jgi:hypothetical protein
MVKTSKVSPIAVAVILGLGIIVVAVIVVLSSGNKGGEAQEDYPKVSRPKKPAKTSNIGKAGRAWKDAIKFSDQHDNDWEAVKAEFEKALEKCKGTKYEDKILKKIEEGDLAQSKSGGNAFRKIETEIRDLLSRRQFDKALGLIGDFEGEGEWMEKAVALQQEIVASRRTWNLARTYPSGESLSLQNQAAIKSFLAECDYDLESAQKGGELTGWRKTGSVVWTSSGGVLTGETGAGSTGSIVYGEDTWVDYVMAFDFMIEKGGGFYFDVHCGVSGNVITIDRGRRGLKASNWYEVHVVVWGDFAVFYCHDNARQIWSGNYKGADHSTRGGFGFRLAENSKIQFKNVRYRRLSLPGQEFVPVRPGWIPLVTGDDTIVTVGSKQIEGATNTWKLKDGILTGGSEGGFSFIELGSPSWTEFEFSFRVRNMAVGMEFEVRRTPDLTSQFSGKYESAKLEVPPLASSSDWVDARIVVGPDSATIHISDKETASASFVPLTSDTILHPIRIGFNRKQAGGKMEMCAMKVKVDKRGGGF